MDAPPGGCSLEGCCCRERGVSPALLRWLALCSPGTPHPAKPPRPGPRLTPPPPPPHQHHPAPPPPSLPIMQRQPSPLCSACPAPHHPDRPSPVGAASPLSAQAPVLRLPCVCACPSYPPNLCRSAAPRAWPLILQSNPSIVFSNRLRE